MSASFTVFVCSTFDDLEQEREGVLDAIRRVQSRHSAMEFFGAAAAQPIETCLKHVRESDVLVVIVAHKYGSLISGRDVSYSEAEYEEGTKLQKQCLVYMRGDDVPVPPKHVETNAKKRKLLKAWKERLQSRHTAAKFADRHDLAVQVAADLGRLVAEQLFGSTAAETAEAKGVAEAPLREVLKRLGETEVAEAEIPDRLAKAADELIRLRADLERLRNERPEFAAIRARASALIDKGDFDAARAVLNEGRERARARRREIAQSLEEISRSEAGFLADEARVDRLQLNYDAACSKFAEAASLDLGNVWIRIELGDLWVTRGSLAEAEKAFSAARDAAARSGVDRDLSVSHNRTGDVQVAQGYLADALKSFRDGLAIADRLTKSDPGNAGWQRDLSVSYEKIGSVQMAQGDLAGALGSYRANFAIIEQLAKSDPGNAGRQRDLSVAHEKIGNVHVAQSDHAAALTSYRDSLAIRDRLAESDPNNTGWQRDLSVARNMIGDVQVTQGDLAGALTSHHESLAIRDRLVKSDPSNAGWQYDLGISNERIGEVQVAQGDLPGALASYRARFSIIDRLANSDPDNANWQRDLAVAYAKIGDALKRMGNRAEALDALRRGHAIMVRLTALSPENAVWKRDLNWFEQQIAELSK
jgi:tetratricopeptide (TPR) repeat protein